MKNLTMPDIKNISFGSQRCSGVTSSMCIKDSGTGSHSCSGGSGAIYINTVKYEYYCYNTILTVSDIHILAQSYYCKTGDSFYFEISGANDSKVGVGTDSSNYNYASCIG